MSGMMDKEAQDFSWIQTSRAQYFLECLRGKNLECERILEELGYRKLPKDKPPLLSDEEINKAVGGVRYYGQTQVANSWLRDRGIALAQRETDIKHYDPEV